MRRAAFVLFVFFAAGALAAQPLYFIQASDPQFGFFADNRNFVQETANWEFVIANVNRLHPTFLIVTGDLTHKAGDAAQIAEYKRINKKLDPAIHLYSVPGNHDLNQTPTAADLAAYRRTYGADYYSFRDAGVYGIVLDSTLFKSPDHVPAEEEKEFAWLETELPKSQASGAVVAVFMHHPLFLKSADEPAGENIPPGARAKLLSLFHRYGVRYVFTGHLHANAESSDGDLRVIVTSAAGRPLSTDPSGFRLAEVTGAEINQWFYGLGSIPATLPDLQKP